MGCSHLQPRGNVFFRYNQLCNRQYSDIQKEKIEKELSSSLCTSLPACGGALQNTIKKSRSSKLDAIFLVFCGERGMLPIVKIESIMYVL